MAQATATVTDATAPAAAFSPKDLNFSYQNKFIDDLSRFKIGAWSRQTGKSHTTAGETVEDCVTDPGTTWVCLSAGERQALEWLGKARDWREAYGIVMTSYAEDRVSGEALMKSGEIKFDNGSRIIAIPANPNTARGYSANILLDEFAYHEDPDAIWAAMFPSITNPLAGTFLDRVRAAVAGEDHTKITRELKVRVVSTFNGRNNKFYNLWENAAKNGFSKHLVSIYDAVKAGLPVNIEQLRAGCDDPDIWAQEFECVPNDVSTVLLTYELLAACESAVATVSQPPEFWLAPAGQFPLVIGIDFGRKRDLTVAWSEEVIGDLGVTKEVLELANTSTPQQVEILTPRIRRAARVSLDYTGPGVGLGDYLVKEFQEWKPEEHKFGKIELVTMTNTNKVDMCSKLRMSFENRREQIPVNRTIREDLHSVYRVSTSSGTITYRAPHSDDGHADRFTAKMLATRARSLLQLTTGRIIVPSGRRSRLLAARRERTVLA